MPLNIVITVSTYYPLKDGVQNITQFYAEELAKSNSVIVVTELREELNYEEYHNGVRIIRLPVTSSRLNSGKINDSDLNTLDDLYSEADVIMNVCLQTTLTNISMRIIKKYKAYKVLYVHGISQFSFPNVPKVSCFDVTRWIYNNIYWRLYYVNIKKYLKLYDKCIHLHRFDSSYVYFNKLGLNNIVLENGVIWQCDDLSKVVDYPYLLCVSRFTDAKNQRFLIEAYYNSRTNMKLILIGNKKSKYLESLIKYENSLREKIGELNENKKVIYLTDLSREITEKYIKNAYIILNGSKTEKYPVTICEAMKAGVPFVSTNVGVVRFLPGGVIAKNPHDMSEQINAISNNLDLYRKLSKEGSKYSQVNQSMENNSNILHRLLERGIMEK